MIRLFMLKLCLLMVLTSSGTTYLVKNLDELHDANKKAQPGDFIMLLNGEWSNVTIRLDCNGTVEKPITFKAQTPGKVLITGNSQLKLGGSYIVVDGFYFTNGNAGDDAVISYRINKEKLANNCRITNCVINDFNNPRRMDENNWVLFYGKNNRLDHCSFLDKKNMGVLLAVILDDDRSRENFHSIDNNYFGPRPALGSNGGEIIRVGVSQHCQFNSNTQISKNFFEHCNGETEIISIKSGSNSITKNIFKESEGSLVLRHGDNNVVTENIFLGNGRAHTGGVRVINKGQKVSKNIFYKCRGTGFKSPMAIMNGIPNSPAHRYVQVIDAEIVNNTFIECSPLSFGEGSDAERTLPPNGVNFANNTFYNTKDSIIYKASDSINGFSFAKNTVNKTLHQQLPSGFNKIAQPVYTRVDVLLQLEKEASKFTGASWFSKKRAVVATKASIVDCKTADDVYTQIEKKKPVTIRLTGLDYIFHKPLLINSTVKITTNQTHYIELHTVPNMLSLFVINGNANLVLDKLNLDGRDVKSTHFVSNDSSGPSSHFNFGLTGCSIRFFNRDYGCENFFYAFKSSIADSIVIRDNYFDINQVNIVVMNNEKDDKGYYNAENIRIEKNNFMAIKGIILDIYRGGNDESTLGPDLLVSDNSFDECNTIDDRPLFSLTGVQKTNIFFNSFMNCNNGKALIVYKDIVRARHILSRNIMNHSGTIEPNQFVTQEKNTIQ